MVRVLLAVAEGPAFKAASAWDFSKTLMFTYQGMGHQLSSELGHVNEVRKKEWHSTPVSSFSVQVGSLTATSQTGSGQETAFI